MYGSGQPYAFAQHVPSLLLQPLMLNTIFSFTYQTSALHTKLQPHISKQNMLSIAAYCFCTTASIAWTLCH
jgi:hypothetical protein